MSRTTDALLEGLTRVLPSLIKWAWGRLSAGDSPQDIEDFLADMEKEVEGMREDIDTLLDSRFPS